MREIDIINKFYNGELNRGDMFKCGRTVLECSTETSLVRRTLDKDGKIIVNDWVAYKELLAKDGFEKQ